MDPITLTAIATSVTTLICSEAAKDIGKAALKDGAQALGKATYAKITQLIAVIRQKFQHESMEGVLNRVQTHATEEKYQTKFRDELIEQISADPSFAEQLQELIADLQAEPEVKQILLKGIQVEDSAHIGDIEQTTHRTTGSIKQEALTNIKVGHNLTIGTIKQSS